MEPIPDSCLKFDKRVREIASVSDTKVTSDKALYRLRPSARQLAQLAEQTKEFEQLVIDLFRSGPADTYESEVVADLIKRCGYYHSVLDAEPPEVYWRKIVDRIPNRER
jgi:hypothetical protein